MLDRELNEKYEELIELITTEDERSKKKFEGKIKCRMGCMQCCHQIFKITMLDASLIIDHIKTLSIEAKVELKNKAIDYLDKQNLNIDKEPLKPNLACPALSDKGECTIYEARPIICRRFGPPIYNYKTPDKIFACEVNFKQGEEISDDDLIPNQTIIGTKWDILKTEYNLKHDKGGDYTTIAEAIANYDVY